MTSSSVTQEHPSHAAWYKFGFKSFAEFNTYVTFVFLGMSIMMVASAVTSAPDFLTRYYVYATGIPNADAETPLFWNNANTFYNAGTYATQVLTEFLSLTPFMRRIPLSVRLFVGLGIPFVELLVIIIVPTATISTQHGAIAVIMVVATVGGFSKALCDSCTNALVGPFPTKFMNGAQWGLTVIALLMSIIQIILKASMGTSFHDIMTMSRIYFGICIGIQIVTIFELVILRFNPFAQKYIAEYRARTQKEDSTEGVMGETLPSVNEPAIGDLAEVPCTTADKERALNEDEHDEVRAVANEEFHVKQAAVLRAKGDADKMVDLDQTGNITSTEQMLRASALSVFKRVYPMLLCVFLVYFTSLLIFPGVFFLVKTNDGWYMTLIITLFNLGDFVSRMLLMFRPLRPSPTMVIGGTLGRLIIIPFLVLCVRGIISGVALPYVLMTLVGLTNGYFGCMACIHCPRTTTLRYAGERSLAAMLSGIAIMLGLCFGSNLSLAITLTH
ncbi:putative mitochondrial inosine-guanosine transporter (NT2) [Leptomonas pyrrhocoris]|uniref:Putative mitochondrial inosine-guanosine transporter (NT2) n=1 Tax=Leptomonas pyrrhocoris TaxID=157538 RepID=A0A0M9G105_LEPPY|nr:putative mitochondrial inosine-guanosine transporter (NT2) [Leptomonas pyrrhocoris]KPA80135.1 putative mitochondrial inosine-guanosine transporter (NT2) [Leptomonas pyrrhocoris]|eukprot:XP_015658574.1 putative mitochondrial inosine-guanosine transporter (NT2) [Leptomonas pyrrhocoris]